MTPLPASGDLYVFGGGTARAVGTYDWTVKCGDVCRTGRLDAVKGSLCLLLGRQFGADFCLSDDMANDEIRQEKKVLPTIDIEGLKHIRVNTAVRAKSSLKRESSQPGVKSAEGAKSSPAQETEEADKQLAEQLQAEEDAVEASLRSEEERAEKRAHARNSKSAQRGGENNEEGEWQVPKKRKQWKVPDNGPLYRGQKSIQVQVHSRIQGLVAAERKKEETEAEFSARSGVAL